MFVKFLFDALSQLVGRIKDGPRESNKDTNLLRRPRDLRVQPFEKLPTQPPNKDKVG